MVDQCIIAAGHVVQGAAHVERVEPADQLHAFLRIVALERCKLASLLDERAQLQLEAHVVEPWTKGAALSPSLHH